jgi:hypothetical protein
MSDEPITFPNCLPIRFTPMIDPAELLRQIHLEAIRAFVERVEKRLPDYDTGRGADSWLKAYRQAVYDELDAMQQETE